MAITNLSELAEAEKFNVEATRKHLGFSADLFSDVESVYKAIPPLIRCPWW